MVLDSLVRTRHHTHHVILVDWSWGSLQLYHQSVSNTRLVGSELARLLLYLNVINFLTVRLTVKWGELKIFAIELLLIRKGYQTHLFFMSLYETRVKIQ